jgi:hypothetical protein
MHIHPDGERLPQIDAHITDTALPSNVMLELQQLGWGSVLLPAHVVVELQAKAEVRLLTRTAD